MNSSQPSIEPSHEFHREELVAKSKSWTRWVRRSVIILLLIVLLVPPTAALYSYFSAIPLRLLAGKENRPTSAVAAPTHATVSPGEPYSLAGPQQHGSR